MRRIGLTWSAARTTALAAMAMAAVALGACGSSESQSATDAANAPTKKSGAAAAQTVRPDMVAAVSSAKGPGTVDVRFSIPARPVVGEPLDIQLSLTPSIELERLVAHFQVPEGVQLVAGGETGQNRPAIGAEINHTLTVVPKADGIYTITAVVLTDSEQASIARTYSIPLIAGAGLPALPTAANSATP